MNNLLHGKIFFKPLDISLVDYLRGVDQDEQRSDGPLQSFYKTLFEAGF